jgi:ANTAR domain
MSQVPGDDVVRADLWDEIAAERQRLADERERLADEREQLANEREQLADEHERRLDQRYDELLREGVIDESIDEQIVQAEAEGRMARAEGRVERSLLERDWAALALERREIARTRRTADATREAQRSVDENRPDAWALERRAFVASERECVADLRDQSQDQREAAADRREKEADDRDQQQRQREDELEGLASRHLAIERRRQDLPRLQRDIAAVREQAERQRRAAARSRQNASRGRMRSRKEGIGSRLAPDADGPLLAAQFVSLSRELFAEPDFVHIVERVLRFALECLPSYVAAGVTVSDAVFPARLFATDAVATQLESFQSEVGEGPSAVAFESSEPVHAIAFDRWPKFADRATELGVRDVLAYGLSVPRNGKWLALGALTFYGETRVELDDDMREIGSMLAAYISVAAGFERDRSDLTRREAALHRALGTRDVIGQAKGILMERQRIPAGEAFDILRRTSQHLNLRLHEVATRLSETGEMPG